MHRVLWLAVFLSFSSTPILLAQKCVIEVYGLRNSKGEVIMSLFQNSEGFPESREEVVILTSAEIVDEKAIFSLQLLPGRYALTFLHDEDLDGEMKYSWIGMPLEGFGFSNNPKIRLKVPGFDQCSFTVDDTGCLQTVEAIYY